VVLQIGINLGNAMAKKKKIEVEGKTGGGKKSSSAAASTVSSAVEFEPALAKLEKIVSQLEQGNLTLAGSLESYHQGVSLLTTCYSGLREAEQQIRILTGVGDDGQISIEDFDASASLGIATGVAPRATGVAPRATGVAPRATGVTGQKSSTKPVVEANSGNDLDEETDDIEEEDEDKLDDDEEWDEDEDEDEDEEAHEDADPESDNQSRLF